MALLRAPASVLYHTVQQFSSPVSLCGRGPRDLLTHTRVSTPASLPLGSDSFPHIYPAFTFLLQFTSVPNFGLFFPFLSFSFNFFTGFFSHFSVFPVLSCKFPCLHLIYCLHEWLHFSIVLSYYIFLLPLTSFLFIGSVLQSSDLPPLVDTALYSTHLCSFCLQALHLVVYHGVALSSDFSPILLFCIHLSTACFTVFTFSFSPFPVFLSPAPVRNFTLPELFASKQHWCLHSHPLPPASTLLAGTKLLRLITVCTLPDINSVLGFPAFLLDSWPLRMGLIGCPETSVRNYHYLLCNSIEEHNSHLLRGGNLKSHKNKTESIENWSVICHFMSRTWSFCL